MTKKELRNETLKSMLITLGDINRVILNDNEYCRELYGHEAIGKMLMASYLGVLKDGWFDTLNTGICEVVYCRKDKASKLLQTDELIETVNSWIE